MGLVENILKKVALEKRVIIEKTKISAQAGAMP
jgi:hypothetical protein